MEEKVNILCPIYMLLLTDRSKSELKSATCLILHCPFNKKEHLDIEVHSNLESAAMLVFDLLC